MSVIKAKPMDYQFNIGIVVSRFNEAVTQRLQEGALERLQELGFTDEQVTVVEVPGAVEIPIIAQQLIRSETYEAIVCLGAVIRGETSHYDYVCSQVSDSCQQLALQYHIPVIFGVLTTENGQQALARVGGEKGHKGKYAVDAAVEMVSLMRQLN